MKSNGHFTVRWVVAILALGALQSAYALNPQPLPPGARAQREGNVQAAKMLPAQSGREAAAAGAAQKGSMAGPAHGSLDGASSKAGSNAAKMNAQKMGRIKGELPAVQRR